MTKRNAGPSTAAVRSREADLIGAWLDKWLQRITGLWYVFIVHCLAGVGVYAICAWFEKANEFTLTVAAMVAVSSFIMFVLSYRPR